ncbi:hypothetical protein JTB14_035150 [Gonioctena quinquepunctata]|nr:hypothetical protein JTB14_035150 [Gonioctena quinquepunctata]
MKMQMRSVTMKTIEEEQNINSIAKRKEMTRKMGKWGGRKRSIRKKVDYYRLYQFSATTIDFDNPPRFKVRLINVDSWKNYQHLTTLKFSFLNK